MGYHLELLRSTQQSHCPVTIVTKDQEPLIEEEVVKLRQKGAIIPVTMGDSQRAGFCSTIFLVPKKESEQMRPVVPLNRFLPRVHFKMEGVHVVRDLLQRGDWVCRIDLKDAIPVCREHQPLLCFIWGSDMYQFTCLPFGLALAPRVFTKVLATSSGFSTSRRSEVCDLPGQSPHHGRQQGPSSLAVCRSNSVTRISRLSRELLQISDTANAGSNLLGPQHRLQERGIACQKLSQIWKQARKLLGQTLGSARDIAPFAGKLSTTVLAIHPAPLHYRGLQHLKYQALRGSQNYNYSSLIRISPADLECWLQEVPLSMEWEESSDHSSSQTTPPELEIDSLTG